MRLSCSAFLHELQLLLTQKMAPAGTAGDDDGDSSEPSAQVAAIGVAVRWVWPLLWGVIGVFLNATLNV